MIKKGTILWIGLLVLLLTGAMLAAACAEGPQGPTGDQGPIGPAGIQGPKGDTGAAGSDAAVAATYTGRAACVTCHADQEALFAKSGHPYKLNKVVNGQAPVYPYTPGGLELPVGYTWSDITYVIGGYEWKARFMDSEGYIINTPKDGVFNPDYKNQYNVPSEENATASWGQYNVKKADGIAYGDLKYNCGRCHTTGYNPAGHQDNLPGIVGTWSEPGVQCEACHGPGSNHVANPYGVALDVDRDAASCGNCHVRDDAKTAAGSLIAEEVIDASGGFIQHHEQYEELLSGKHSTLDCVSCHNPHSGVVQGREDPTLEPVRVKCDSCHYKQAATQASAIMKSVVKCTDCHMAKVDKSAVGTASTFTGDIMTHLFAINPSATSQFSTDGKSAISQITLDYACKTCHRTGGTASVKTDAELIDRATDYHS